MDPAQMFFAIPIIAIVLGIGKGIVNSVLQTYERVNMAKLQMRQSSVGPSDGQLSRLSAEIAQLRDTTTQHAISLQHSVERLERRVDFIETKTMMLSSAEPPAASPPLQVVGRG